jgi:hypothetical protein
MRLVRIPALAAGLVLVAAAAPALAQQDCQARLAALDTLLAERHPGVFEIEAPPAAATGGALSGNPALSTATPTAEDVPTSAMPGAGPEVELAEEKPKATGQGSTGTVSRPSKEGPAGTPLSQEEIDRVVTLRTLAEERLSAGKEEECRAAVDEARGIAGG